MREEFFVAINLIFALSSVLITLGSLAFEGQVVKLLFVLLKELKLFGHGMSHRLPRTETDEALPVALLSMSILDALCAERYRTFPAHHRVYDDAVAQGAREPLIFRPAVVSILLVDALLLNHWFTIFWRLKELIFGVCCIDKLLEALLCLI